MALDANELYRRSMIAKVRIDAENEKTRLAEEKAKEKEAKAFASQIHGAIEKAVNMGKTSLNYDVPNDIIYKIMEMFKELSPAEKESNKTHTRVVLTWLPQAESGNPKAKQP